MNQKRFITIFLTLILALACCSCAPKTETSEQETTEQTTLESETMESETPEQVYEKMQTAMAENPFGKAQLIMDMEMVLDAGELGVQEMSTTITNDITISQDPVSSYTNSTAEIAYGEESVQTTSENYTVVENGELVSYTHSSGVWIKLSTGQTIDELKQSASAISIDIDNASIDESITELDGKEVICLTTQFSGASMGSVLDNMLGGMGLDDSDMSEAADVVSSFDYSTLTCDAKILLDKATYLPISEKTVINGMSELLAPLYSDLGMKLDIPTCAATMYFLSYEPQEEVVLPEGAADKAAAWERLIAGDPENGDGTFTIREGSYLVDIAAPEGFELAEKGYDHVYFTRDDQRQLKYTMYYGSAENLATEADKRLNRYGDLPNKVSRDQMTLDGEFFSFACDIISVEWSSYEEGVTYAWAELGTDGIATYYLFVEVMDGYNDGLGNSKSADMTPDEFMSYLNAGTLSDLME